MEKEEAEFSILMFPWLAYSHVFPFLQQARKLSKGGFHIYFCSSAVNLDFIKTDVFYDASIDLIELDLPVLPQLPPHFHTTKNLPPNLVPILLQAFQESKSSFSEILNALNPDLVIYDFFQPWAARLAQSRGIPSVYFATSGATPFAFYYHLLTYGSSDTFPYESIYLLDHERPPPSSKFENMDEESHPFVVFELSCAMILIKSLREIEGKYIDYLSELCHKKVIPTGPLVQESNNKNREEYSNILGWLSKKEEFSTVFICFGSEHFVSREQILEIAKGLELCEVNFIWVIRFPEDEATHCLELEDLLSEGFLARVKGRGLVLLRWAPQAEILAQKGIGGFMSHCGWSSTMESVYYGVTIIAMPIKYDQPINGRLMVEVGAGVEVERDENGLFRGVEVAKAIKKVILETDGEGLRDGARKLSEKMKQEEEEAANQVIEELLKLCNNSKQ